MRLERTLAGFPTLRQAGLKLGAVGREFVIVLIPEFGVSVSLTRALRLRVKLSLQLPVLHTVQDRCRLQLACKKHDEAWDFIRNLQPGQSYQYEGPIPFRWASGGCLPILRIDGKEYVVLLYRDCPSFYPIVGWNLPLGCSKSAGDLVRLDLLAEREFKQEILVVNTRLRTCYRLELPGGTVSMSAHYQQLARMLNLRVAVEREPLIATCATGPDQAIVTADWEKQSWPHVTQTGFFVFTPRNGEMGIEYIQIPTWDISASLHDLRIYDGRFRRDPRGRRSGLTEQPVALFPVDEMLWELQKTKPCLRPAVVFESGGWALSGDGLTHWLKQQRYADRWTPATLEILRRYLSEVRKVGDNGFHKQADRWSIRYEGRPIWLGDSVGLRHIQHLVRNAGQEISCRELQEQNGRCARAIRKPAGEADGINPTAEGLSVVGTLGIQPISDPKAQRDYKGELRRLGEELRELKAAYDEAERFDKPAEAECLKAKIAEKIREIECLQKESARSRPSNCFPDRWRRNPTKAVHRSINRTLRVISAGDGALGEHLKKSLKLRSRCVYNPSTPCHWRFVGDEYTS